MRAVDHQNLPEDHDLTAGLQSAVVAHVPERADQEVAVYRAVGQGVIDRDPVVTTRAAALVPVPIHEAVLGQEVTLATDGSEDVVISEVVTEMTEVPTINHAIKTPGTTIVAGAHVDIIIGTDLIETTEVAVGLMITTIIVVETDDFLEPDMAIEEEVDTEIIEIEDMTEAGLEIEADHTADLLIGLTNPREELEIEMIVRKRLTSIPKEHQLKENSQ